MTDAYGVADMLLLRVEACHGGLGSPAPHTTRAAAAALLGNKHIGAVAVVVIVVTLFTLLRPLPLQVLLLCFGAERSTCGLLPAGLGAGATAAKRAGSTSTTSRTIPRAFPIFWRHAVQAVYAQ